MEDKIQELQEVIKESHKEISSLKAENESISETLNETKVHLKRYTAPASKKKYYQENKEKIINRVKKYQERTNYKQSKEQAKEYYKNTCLRRKEKLEETLEKEEKDDI